MKKSKIPKITVDKNADAIYVYLRQGKVTRTVEASDSEEIVNIDYDSKGKIVGVEILPSTSLENLSDNLQ